MKKHLLSSFLATALTITTVLLASPVMAHGGRPLHTTLINRTSQIDGEVHLTLNHGQGEICYDIQLAHTITERLITSIHKAGADAFTYFTLRTESSPTLNFDSTGHAVGCMTGVDRNMIKAIIQNPEIYTVKTENRHVQALGQLSK